MGELSLGEAFLENALDTLYVSTEAVENFFEVCVSAIEVVYV